jgi:hypothetical protein
MNAQNSPVIWAYSDVFDTKNGGLRKKQPREWHQLAFFLNASFRQ